jgi:hypothetical protein
MRNMTKWGGMATVDGWLLAKWLARRLAKTMRAVMSS